MLCFKHLKILVKSGDVTKVSLIFHLYFTLREKRANLGPAREVGIVTTEKSLKS